jgi:DNA invertase Pin-like site-specific DNA recombinase
MKKRELIPAVAYRRKSTKGYRKNEKAEKQEKSLQQQKREIEKLAGDEGYVIVRWYEDEGVSGWKVGKARPQFYQMLQDAGRLSDFKAILTDDIDRFSRAKRSEVRADMAQLVNSGVKILHTVAQRRYDLEDDSDLAMELVLTIDIWTSRQYSVKHSRRISLARRDLALKGYRSGGNAPYGYENTGTKYHKTLKLGPRRQVEIVKWIFDQYANRGKNLNQIVTELNRQKEPGPTGDLWQSQTVRLLLQNRTYIGELGYGDERGGHFHSYDKDGNVVPIEKLNGEKWEGIHKQAHTEIIDRKTFDRAQKLLASRKAVAGPKQKHVLSGVLVCAACGGSMYGFRRIGNPNTAYRCNTNRCKGSGNCESGQVPETRLLSWFMQELGPQLKTLKGLVEEKSTIRKSPAELREDKTRLRNELAEFVKRNVERLATIPLEDPETFADLSRLVSEKRVELRKLEAELQIAPSNGNDSGLGRMITEALKKWKDFFRNAVAVPLPKRLLDESKVLLLEDPADDGSGRLVDSRLLNRYLREELGAEIRIHWRKNRKVPAGVPGRYSVGNIEYRLGQDGPRYVIEGADCPPRDVSPRYTRPPSQCSCRSSSPAFFDLRR